MAVKFKILSLFKDSFYSYLNSSLIKRGIDSGHIIIEIVDFRDYTTNKHRKVDDTIYGGGPGMLLTVQPLYDAINDIKEENDLIVFLTPNGKLLDQNKIVTLSNNFDSFILICGKYEGFDARIFNFFEHEKISIGNYILTGGELPALIILDAISRYKGILHNEDSVKSESFTEGLLEYDQYTKPRIFKNEKVPEVLLNGNHAKIEQFRKKSSIINTIKYRPELLEKVMFTFNEDEKKLIEKLKSEIMEA